MQAGRAEVLYRRRRRWAETAAHRWERAAPTSSASVGLPSQLMVWVRRRTASRVGMSSGAACCCVRPSPRAWSMVDGPCWAVRRRSSDATNLWEGCSDLASTMARRHTSWARSNGRTTAASVVPRPSLASLSSRVTGAGRRRAWSVGDSGSPYLRGRQVLGVAGGCARCGLEWFAGS